MPNPLPEIREIQANLEWLENVARGRQSWDLLDVSIRQRLYQVGGLSQALSEMIYAPEIPPLALNLLTQCLGSCVGNTHVRPEQITATIISMRTILDEL